MKIILMLSRMKICLRLGFQSISRHRCNLSVVAVKRQLRPRNFCLRPCSRSRSDIEESDPVCAESIELCDCVKGGSVLLWVSGSLFDARNCVVTWFLGQERRVLNELTISF